MRFIKIKTPKGMTVHLNTSHIVHTSHRDEYRIVTTQQIWYCTLDTYIKALPYIISNSNKELKELNDLVEDHFERVYEWENRIYELKRRLDILNVYNQSLTIDVLKSNSMFEDYLEANADKEEVYLGDTDGEIGRSSCEVIALCNKYNATISCMTRYIKESILDILDM
jgi:hypothetical protein